MAKKKPATETPKTPTQIVWCCNVSPALNKAALAEIKRRGIKGRGAKAELTRLGLAMLCGNESLAEARIGRPPKNRDDA